MTKRFLNTTSFICGLLAGIAVLLIADYFFNSSAKQIDPLYNLLAIHGVDASNVEHEAYCFYIDIPNSIPLIDKVQVLASKMSKFELGNRPITVADIELRKGKKIAIIDLHDGQPLTPNDMASWYARFQGSLNGVVTETVLIKSFLQEDYQGEWLDGVEFLYQGKPFYEDQWDHIQLHGTFMRDGTRLLSDGTVEQIYPIYTQTPSS